MPWNRQVRRARARVLDARSVRSDRLSAWFRRCLADAARDGRFPAADGPLPAARGNAGARIRLVRDGPPATGS